MTTLLEVELAVRVALMANWAHVNGVKPAFCPT